MTTRPSNGCTSIKNYPDHAEKQNTRFTFTPSFRSIIFPLALLLSPSSSAQAGELTLSVMPRYSIDESARTLTAEFTITNHGGELARDVGIRLITAEREEIFIGELFPTQSVTKTVILTLDELHIPPGIRGDFFFPFWVVYKDVSFYPLDAPQVGTLSLPPAPGRSATVRLLNASPTTALELSTEKAITLFVEVKNIGHSTLRVHEIIPFTSTELSLTIASATPRELSPGDRFTLPLTVKNLSAFPGSQYPVTVLVSGQLDGKAFAVNSPLQPVRIVTDEPNPYYALIASVIVIALSYAFLPQQVRVSTGYSTTSSLPPPRRHAPNPEQTRSTKNERA